MSCVAEKQMEQLMKHLEKTKPAVIAVRVADDLVHSVGDKAEEVVEVVVVEEKKKTTKSK